MPASNFERGNAMSIDTFDFDEWATLAQSAPEVFEQRRSEYVEHLISACGDASRLHGLQCRIDMERARAHTAMKSCLRMSSLMWDSLLDCQDALDVFVRLDLSSEPPASPPVQEAEIIPFRRKI